MALARERGLLVPLLFGCFMRGLTLTGKGEYDDAFALFNEGLSVAERVGDEAVHHRLLNCLGWLFAELGDLEESETLNARSAQIGRRRSDPGTYPNAELNLGEVYGAWGELDRAQDRFDTIFKYYKNPSSSEWMRFRYSIRMFAGMGELAVTRRDLSIARAHSAESLELATRAASRKSLVKAWRLAGEIAQAERDWDRAEGHLRKSRDLAVSLGNPVQRWKAELALGNFLQEVGRPDEARHSYERGLAEMVRVRAGLRHERLKEAFEKNPDLRLLQSLVAGV
jgi:tetratricopeptide (TPR) repeat protein